MSFGFRSLLAGPSRPSLRPPHAVNPRIRFIRCITIPHPALDPSNGHTKLCARTTTPIPSIIHAFAMLRAIEDRFGRVYHIHVPKDPDTQKPLTTIFVTLLRPVKLDKAEYLEIASPAVEDLRYGGPSFGDIQRAWEPEGDAEDGHGDARRRVGGEKGRDGTRSRNEVIQFRVEVAKRPPRITTPPMRRRPPRPEEQEEDREIMDVLRRLGGGPHGGFDGLVEKLESLGIGIEEEKVVRRRTARRREVEKDDNEEMDRDLHSPAEEGDALQVEREERGGRAASWTAVVDKKDDQRRAGMPRSQRGFGARQSSRRDSGHPPLASAAGESISPTSS